MLLPPPAAPAPAAAVIMVVAMGQAVAAVLVISAEVVGAAFPAVAISRLLDSKLWKNGTKVGAVFHLVPNPESTN